MPIPPGDPIPAGWTVEHDTVNGLWWIRNPDTTIGYIRTADGTTFEVGVTQPEFPRDTKFRFGDVGPEITVTRWTAASEVLPETPGPGIGAEEAQARPGQSLVLPLFSAALLVAAMVDGLNAIANSMERCINCLARLVSAIYSLNAGMALLGVKYQEMSARLDAAIARATGHTTQDDAMWMVMARTNLTNAMGEINRRQGISGSVYAYWQGFSCSVTATTGPGTPQLEGPSVIANLTSLYNDGLINLATWDAAVSACEHIASELNPPN